MITYTLQKIYYSEMIGLSKDEKPIDAGNGSLFYEMDTGKSYRFDAETKRWICAGDPYPTALEKQTAKKSSASKKSADEKANKV